jgi:hypothetical protein
MPIIPKMIPKQLNEEDHPPACPMSSLRILATVVRDKGSAQQLHPAAAREEEAVEGGGSGGDLEFHLPLLER